MFGSVWEESSFLRHYLWKYRKLALTGVAALLLVDSLEVLLPLLLKQVIDSIAAQSGSGSAAVIGSDIGRELALLAGAYLGISVIQGFCRYVWRMWLVRASMLSGRDLRQKYADHLFGLSASFYDRNRVGDLMSLATNDTLAIRRAIGAGVITIADAAFYLLTVPIAMYWLSPQLTLLAFAPMIALPFLVVKWERQIHARFEKVQASFSKLAAIAQENLMGIRLVKAYARENTQIARFAEAGQEYIRLNLRLARVQSAFGPTLDFFMSLGLVLLLYFGGKWVIGAEVGGSSPGLTIGTFVAFQRYIQKMVWPMSAVGHAVTFYQRAVASSDRMKRVLANQTDVPEVREPKLPERAKNGAPVVPGGPWKTEGRVEFRNLSFAFAQSQAPILKNLSLTIEAGERVAFIGSIGAGKSALFSLIPRLYPVQDGMLWVDGVDINHWPIEELRRQLGFVAQDVFLFSESVSENLAFGLAPAGAAEATTRQALESVWRAAELASVHHEILGLNRSYETILGERGINISGGQKQRLTIARAIAKEPSILILDDALSSVDVETEEKILRGLRARTGRNTEIIAAHRISTIQEANRIVVLERGEIRQVGTHQELTQDRRGLYRKYYDQQRLKQELDHYVETLAPA